jgi:thioredoxin reductase (NADPH)
MITTDLAIIGGGVAGLTAGLFAVRDRVETVLLERMGTGGWLVNADQVENFPGFPQGIKGYELGPLISEQAMNAGLRIEFAEVQALRRTEDGFILETDGEPVRARAVIAASGSSLAKLGIPGEAEFEGRGVSGCATCDGEFFRDQAVAVIGGGDSAFDEALYLAEICASVTIVHRSPPRAQRVLVERAVGHPRITLHRGEPAAIEGAQTVTGLRLRDGTALPVAGVFIYVGLRPNTEYLADLVPLDLGGHVPVDLWMRTPMPGLLAAGDLRQHSARQLVASAGDGATAALAAIRYLRAGEWRT